MGTATAPQHYGQRIRERREDVHLSVEKMRDLLLVTIPRRYVPSGKSLHRIEAGERPEEAVEGILIVGIAKVLGCRISDISEQVAAEYEEVSGLLASSSRWITTCPGQLDLGLDKSSDLTGAAA